MATYSADERRQMAANGQAMPDGSYPIKNREDLSNAIQAVGRGNAPNPAIRRHIMKRARALNATDMIPDTWNADGSLSRAEELRPREFSARTYNVADAHVRQDGGGRIVEALITPFNNATEIHDVDGHYMESIQSSAFNKTLNDRGLNFAVLYNHGRTFDGRTDGNLMVPIGVPRLIEPRDRGLYSETEYLDNPLADSVLDGIKKGAIRGYSFTGRFVKSSRSRPAEPRGLPMITRSEVMMREYGPVLYPAYEAAAITGTRMADLIAQIDPEDVDRLRALLGLPAELDATRQPASRQPANRAGGSHSARISHTIRRARIARGLE